MAYPSPCEKCTVTNKETCNYKKCGLWVRRYWYKQKQINAFAKKLAGHQTVKHTHWTYMHPDELRRYIASDPCKGCLVADWCDDPCPKYLHHFAMKMEYIRKRAKSHERKTDPCPDQEAE